MFLQHHTTEKTAMEANITIRVSGTTNNLIISEQQFFLRSIQC